MKKYLAELAGTMVLVLLGCGAAIGGALAAGVWKVIEPENNK